MLRQLGIIEPDQVQSIVEHLNAHKERLSPDVSSYAKNRSRYWLQHEWSLNKRSFSSAVKDSRIWDLCKEWMPDADLGLVIHGPVGIKPHRDDSYADWRGVGINLGEVESWYYDCQYPEYRWSPSNQCNPSNPMNYKLPVGAVFEFNTKNPHAVNNPAEDRWAIFLWKLKNSYRAQVYGNISSDVSY